MTRRSPIFARLYVSMRNDAALYACSDAAFRLYVSAILWCRDDGNEGIIPTTYLAGLSPIKRPGAAAAELVKAGLWSIRDDGWRVRHYAEYQDTPDVIHARSQAGRASAQARWNGHDA